VTEPDIRPVPGDPSAKEIAAEFEFAAENWVLADFGDYQTAAAQVRRTDGGWEPMVVLEFPGRYNKTKTRTRVRMISPEDAAGLAEVLAHTTGWLQEAEALGRLGGERGHRE
jgi:hypothetical protein